MKTIKIILSVIIILSLQTTQSLSAQTGGTLVGTVYDAQSNEPLPGLAVQIEGIGLEGPTNVYGQYEIIEIPPGTYLASVSLPGYTAGEIHTVTIYAGEITVQDFWLGNPTIPIISLTGTNVSNITSSTAESGGNIITDGGSPVTRRGVCWSISPNPTTANYTTWNGEGTGEFNSYISGLSGNTTYYLRAYAVNGVGTAYGQEISFTTLLSDRQIDSLALIDLYNSTNGPEWTNNDNWLVENQPIDSWYGITVSGDRVIQITLNRNNLNGSIPSSIGDLTSLNRLDLWTNQLYGSIPSEIGNLTNLIRLYLNSNNLSGEIPVGICQLTNLEILYLSSNQFTGSILPEFGAMTGLTVLSLGNNQFTGSIPPALGQLINLTNLDLIYNQIEGLIPPELGNLSNLEFLLLKSNNLSGEIPLEIYGIATLRQLHVGINNLSGTIPPEIENLTNLQFLMLYDNQFSGELPTELGTLSQLARLDIGSNSFTGALPGGITGLTSLLHIKIENNQFSSLPDLSSLPVLDSLFVQNNMLTFRDIEPNIGAAATYFEYAPQANIPAEKDTTLYLASEMTLSVSAGGDYSQYQWYKDDIPLGAATGDSTLYINPVNLDDAGDYKCVVTNTLATELTLYSDIATLEVLPEILVSNTGDSGTGSLRNAINFANTITGPDEIVFNIEGTGPFTIQPLSPLPVITESAIIDGYTQTGSAPNTNEAGQGLNSVIMIELNGSLAGLNATGLNITSDNVTVRGLCINHFTNRGILLQGNGNTVEGNFIGTDVNGSNASGFGNGVFGIHIDQSDNNNITSNVISGNGGSEPNPGLLIANGSTGNEVYGNYIGTDATGLVALANSGSGINIGESPGNTIGGTGEGERNIIYDGIQITGEASINNKIVGNYLGFNVLEESTMQGGGGIVVYNGPSLTEIGPGNVISGISVGNAIVINDANTHDNKVTGNLIGLDPNGTFALSNNSTGIVIFDSPNNTIGSSTAEEKNVISGSLNDQGISISGASSTGNQVLGNYIGTDASGNNSIGNAGGGVIINSGASDNIIGPSNLISGNNDYGILVQDDNTSGNKIIGNLIGTKANGMEGLGNLHMGVLMSAPNNIIGGYTPEERNIISANDGDGIVVYSNNATGTEIYGNYLGTDITGNGSLLNSATDLRLNNSSFSIVGGLEPGARNVIGSMAIVNEGANNNQVIGNYIGLNKDGTGSINSEVVRSGILISDASDNVIGPGNVISGVEEGIWITEYFGVPEVITINNRIIGNYIGTNADGSQAVSNRVGIHIDNVQEITVGGSIESERNIISGNDIGVNITGPAADNNIVSGNYIGTDVTGSQAIPNTNGVWIFEGNNNIIGGSEDGSGNVISGSNDNGVWINGSETSPATGNKVLGNYIGLTASGTDVIGNHGFGIKINESYGNIIGGPDPADRNIVSGNGSFELNRHGIHIEYDNSGIGNIVEGNYIGTDYTGTVDLGNNYIGIVMYYSSSNTIRNNLVSGNRDGIYVYKGPEEFEADSNIIRGNLIGTKANGIEPLGNQDDGIGIQGGRYNIIGGPDESDRNIISGNRIGIRLLSPGSSDNLIKGNYIGTDKSGEEPLPNTENGIYVYGAATGNTIGGTTISERNIISGNGTDDQGHGILIENVETSGNSIIGNFIGVDKSGEKALPNTGDGIQIRDGANNNIIGEKSSGRNIISGNGITAISIFGGAHSNKCKGNYIGLDAEGIRNIGHPGGSGIYIGLGSHSNIIGGNDVGEGNYISGNTGWAGVAVEGVGAEGNVVRGNNIGININGEEGYGNKKGVRIYDGASNNILGGYNANDGNIIAYSDEEGVIIYNDENNTDPTTGNLILSNRIFSNASMGIDLGGDGMTENDNQDTDEGPNNLQNYPVLDSLSFKPGYVTVGGYLNSTPNTSFNLQFFASKIGDNTTYGEGQFYLGSDSVVTDANGDASYTSTFPIKGTMGQVITATATDPDGNTSEFSRLIGGVKDHILSEINNPFYYYINKDGLPTISDDSDLDAIRSAFQAWNDVSSAEIEFIDAGTTTEQKASATDGINLVTFRDEEFPFAPGVLAVAAKTLKISPTGDVAEILDADIVFNPDYVNSNDWYFGIAESEYDTTFFDVQSVTTHEIGHLLGMIHTGAPSSTMFFMLSPGTSLRSLEKDDIAWVNFRYPDSLFQEGYATISGNIRYGDIGDVSDPYDPGTHPPVAGALVLAINSVSKEMIHTYSDAYGNYCVPVPVKSGTTESYWIHIQPLDGDVFGFPLRPGNISSYIYSNTIYTDYPDEWYNGPNEAATDLIDDVNEGKETVIAVSPGESITGINLITNKDDKPPYVIDVIPSATSYNDTVNITSDIIVRFSEPIEIKTFTEQSCFLAWDTLSSGGDYWYFYEDSIHIIGFTPERPLKYDTEYSVHLTAAISDLKQNYLSLDNEIITTFKTRPPDTTVPAIVDIIPEPDADSVFVSSTVKLKFSEPMDHNITKGGLKLSTPDGNVLEGDYDWSSYNTRLEFTPWRYLLEGTEYEVFISTNLVDISGNPIEKDSVMTFTTVPQANPEVIYIGPADNATGITVETPIVVDFSEPVNVTTMSPQTFRLLDAGGSQVPGYFEFLLDNSRVVFRPYDDLDFGGTYTVELTQGIYDVSDPALPLASTVLTTFTCALEPQAPYIHYLDPPAGIIGSVVMLNGSGFDPNPQNNKVSFNGTTAPVKRATISTIAVEVPIGALSGPVTVEVNSKISNQMQYNVLLQTDDPCEDITANINTGTKSRDVAIDPEAGLAYVTNSLSGTVSVIGLNLDPPAEIETIKVGDYPMSIDIDAMGNFAYVTNYYSHTVSAINLLDYTVKDIVVGENPYGVVVSPDGKVYVSNSTSKDVSVIDVDPQSGGYDHVIANISTGTNNRDIEISPEAGFALVAGDNGLTIIDLNPESVNYNSVIANVNSGTKTRDVEVTPEAGLAIVTTEDGNIFIVDIYPTSDSFGSVIANISTGTKSRDIEISPETGFAYVTNEEGSVSVYKLDFGVPGTVSGSYYSQVTLTLHALISAEEIGANELEGLTIDYTGEKLYVVDPDHIDGNGQVIEITLCCGPLSPQQSIANMIINVQNLLNSGYIDEGEANALLTKLYNAQKKLDNGQTHVAINILGAFIEQLIDLKESGSIPEDRVDAMIYATYAIIYELENPPLKGLTLDYKDPLSDGEGFLERLYPNPFSEELNIHFNTLSDTGEDIFVDIRIYNFNGQLVKVLTSMYMPKGNYLLKWDGNYDNGQKGSKSIYLIDFRAGKTRETRTILYLE